LSIVAKKPGRNRLKTTPAEEHESQMRLVDDAALIADKSSYRIIGWPA
jgi:hypothetical protein